MSSTASRRADRQLRSGSEGFLPILSVEVELAHPAVAQEEPRALFVTSLFFRVAKGLRKPLTPGTSEFPYVFSRFASQSQENHDFYPTALLCGVSIAMYDGGLV